MKYAFFQNGIAMRHQWWNRCPIDHANIRVLNTNELSASVLRCASLNIVQNRQNRTRLLVDGGRARRGWDANITEFVLLFVVLYF